MPAQIEPKLTVDDLDLLPDDGNRYELIEGELLVSTAPGLPHQRIAGMFHFEISLYLRQHPVGEVIATPGMMFDVYNATIPDLIYMSHERRDQIEHGGRLRGAPELVIEVLSPGDENRRRDEVVKRQTYGKFGVEEYWIVDPEQHVIEVYRLSDGALLPVATLAEQDTLTTPLLPNFALKLSNMFNR